MFPVVRRQKSSISGPSLDDFVERFFYGWPFFEKETDLSWSPRADVNETDDEIIIDIELPGLDKEDIAVDISDNTLTVSGERKQERKTKSADSYRIERHYGKFEREFGLPDTVDADNIKAQFNGGVLSLSLPKTEKSKTQKYRVEIT